MIKVRDIDMVHGFMEPSASVYVVTLGRGVSCKIGYASDVRKRTIGIQTSNIEDVTVYWACRLRLAEAVALEKAAHKELKKAGKHLRGEWFRVHPLVAVRLLKRLAEEMNLGWIPDLCFGFDRWE